MSNELDDQAETITFLSSPLTYGANVKHVECLRTHGSFVFLAGDQALKLKRAVHFPYMDYSTVARRHLMCERELAVNRRTAPELYLDVRPIIKSAGGGLAFGALSDANRALDWVVVMKRFDQAALMESMRRSGSLSPGLLRLTADAIAKFHRGAEVTSGYGGEPGIGRVVEENIAMLHGFVGRPFQSEKVSAYAELSRASLSRLASRLEQRRLQGYVRRCHGDLHLNNICVLDGNPVLFDAIEFDDNFSCIDVLYDVAFLLMDLDRRGLRREANIVLNRYLESADAYDGLDVLPLFLSCRAAVRSHVTMSMADAGADDARLSEADELLSCALSYLKDDRPHLLAIGGLSGTGKSTLAFAIAPLIGKAPGAVVIRSDVIRKQLMGVSENTRLPQEAYTAAVSAHVYRRVAGLAEIVIAAGHSVITDAVFGSERERLQIAEIAVRAGIKFDGIWLEAPEDILQTRIQERHGDASDATIDVLRAQTRSVTKPRGWLPLDATAPTAHTVANIRRQLHL